MTKFEREIFFAIHGFLPPSGTDNQLTKHLMDEAKAAAEVAKKYIEKAWDFKEEATFSSIAKIAFKTKAEWLKENGITE